MENRIVMRPICIFCEAELGPETKPEHILLSALGGRKTTRQALCSKHNQAFGGTIDDALARQVAFIRNQLQLESGTGKSPPGLGEVQAGQLKVRIGGDGIPQLAEKPFEVTPLGEGRFQVRITTTSIEQIQNYLPHIAAQIGTTVEHLRAQLAKEEASVISQRPGMIHRPNPLGGELECRAMLKACLVLWATEVGNPEVKGNPYALARAYVLHGGDFRASLDSRPLPMRDTLMARYGQFFNLVYIASDANGRVLAHFTLYNLVAWRFVLAESGGLPNRKVALISNPQKPADWTANLASEFDLDMAWLEHPVFETAGPQGQLAAVLGEAQQEGMRREVARIVDDVWRKHNLAPDQPVSDPDLMRAISNEIAHRLAFHVMDLPFEEKITGAELLACTTNTNL
ncbi:MAG TPA: HNH endonuclease [Rhizomicrobium sp.]|nr:HNH endonuclease [Rhizomicrobium sp.]